MKSNIIRLIVALTIFAVLAVAYLGTAPAIGASPAVSDTADAAPCAVLDD